MTNFIKNKGVVVVGVDYSQNSNDALRAAYELAGTAVDAAVHLVHVARASRTQPFAGMARPFASSSPSPTDELNEEKREIEELIQRTAAMMEKNSPHLFGHLRTGDPGREIVQLASDLSANLIVVGTHGRTGVMKLLLGSVAQNVLTNARCPVLVVKPQGLPTWPEIEPPCADCLEVQQSTHGQVLWCERHSQHRMRAHTYSAHSDTYGMGAQTFRGLPE